MRTKCGFKGAEYNGNLLFSFPLARGRAEPPPGRDFTYLHVVFHRNNNWLCFILLPSQPQANNKTITDV